MLISHHGQPVAWASSTTYGKGNRRARYNGGLVGHIHAAQRPEMHLCLYRLSNARGASRCTNRLSWAALPTTAGGQTSFLAKQRRLAASSGDRPFLRKSLPNNSIGSALRRRTGTGACLFRRRYRIVALTAAPSGVTTRMQAARRAGSSGHGWSPGWLPAHRASPVFNPLSSARCLQRQVHQEWGW